MVEGVSLPDLKKGPGHYPETPLPGQEGNAAIAGHRTTYGAPFNRLDELEPGDEVTVTTVQGEFTYEVTETQIVSPTQVDVLDDKGDNRLTLSACHPKYSARAAHHRGVAAGRGGASPSPGRPEARRARLPAASWRTSTARGRRPGRPSRSGSCARSSGSLAWAVGRRWRKWPAYLIGLPFFLVALFFFFEEFSRLLPSNY